MKKNPSWLNALASTTTQIAPKTQNSTFQFLLFAHQQKVKDLIALTGDDKLAASTMRKAR
jgi:hypothetical protein